MTNSRKISIISLIVIVALAFALIFTMAVTTVAQAEGPESFAVTLSEQYIDAAPWDSEPGTSEGLTFPTDLTFTPAITYDVNDTSNVCANFYAFDDASRLVIMVRKATTDDDLLMALFDKGQDLAVTFNGHELTYHEASQDFGSGVGYYHQYVSDYGSVLILLTDYTDNTYEADAISIQINISNAAYAALQGNDPQTPQSGNESAPDVVELHASDIPERDGALVVGDIPDFQAVTLEVAQAWDGVPETGIAMLLYDVTGSDGFAGCFFQDGEYKSSMTTILNCNAIKDSIGNGYSLFYTRGVVSAQDPEEQPVAHVHDDITFTAWESATSLPTEAGSYYLTQDVTISSSWNVPTGATNLCLNGHVISAASNVYISVVTIKSGATLNLYDCDTTTHYYYIDATTYKQNRAPKHDKMYDIGEIATDGPTNSAYVAATKKGTFEGGYITGGTGQSLTTNSSNISGGGFQIYGGGTLNMYGGCVFGNYTSATSSQGNEGGGVYVYQNGVFNMNGGYIIGNQGGNVSGGVQNLGTFTMNDGYIAHNTAGDGGWANGGGIGNSGTMTMNGGVIEGNEAGAHGDLRGKCGGAIENNGSLTINGGSIINNFCDNVGGGIYMSSASASLTIGAGAKITGNYNDETQKADNVYLGANKLITIGSVLTEENSVGVTLKNGTGVFTSGLDGNLPSGKTVRDVFFSDDEDYGVMLAGTEAMIGNHTHDYATEWSKDGAKHWRACMGVGECDAPKMDEAAHVYANTTDTTDYYTCAICGYENATRKAVYDQEVECTHRHDGRGFTAWTSTTSLPSAAGYYYLTGDVTLGGTWNKPSGDVGICLNGYGIKTTSGRVITMNGGTLSLYDCGTTTHYFDVDSNGKAINVNDESGEKSFKGGYITGGKGGNGLSNTSLYWGEGGGILVWSGTFNMYGGTILGNAAGHGGGVEVVNATMNFYGGNIIYNQAAGNLGFGNKNGEGGAGINLRSQSGNTVTLNMYGGNVCYNKGTAIDQSYCYGNRQFNLYSGNISHNNGSGAWVSNLVIDGDPVIEDNTGWAMPAVSLSIKGSPVIRNNGTGSSTVGNVRINTGSTITIAGPLYLEEPIGVTMQNNGTGVFTSGASTLAGDPLSYFYSDNVNYRVVTEDDELKLIEGRTLYINNLQGTIKSIDVEKTDTIASVKATAATLFGVNAADYMLLYEGDDLNESDTVESAGIPGRSTLEFVPIAGGLKTLTLVPSVDVDATEVAPGVYSAIREGDTITITYASTQNSGFSEAIFTTAFDEEYLHLTAISVDETYYTILNDYGMAVGNDYVPMTLAEWIAAHNAALDAGEEPYSARLTLSMAFKADLFDEAGVLSDHFITVTYSVVKDVPAGTTLNFGFDMALDGMFTNAAYDDEILLNIIDAEGKTVDEKMVTLVVKNVTEVTIPEDQVLTFHRSGNNYIVVPADIELTWNEPTFGAQEANPYIADGGKVTYTFYVKNGDEYEPIVGVPTAVGDYFVKATLTETDAYLGYETDYVAITVAKILVDVPDLKLYAGEDSATPTYDDKVLGITKGGVVYGTTLTLKEIVDNAEVAYALPATSGSVDDLTYSFKKADGDNWTAVNNFFSSQPLAVGTYQLTITPKNGDYVAFDADPEVDAITIEITIVKAKVVAPTETTSTYTYDGTEQTYTFETVGSEGLYTVTNDKRTDAGEQTVTVAIKDKANYEWEEGGVDDLPFTFVINKKKLTVKTYINGEVELALTYGDAAPNANAFTFVVEGIVAAEADDINAALQPLLAITAVTNDYEQYAGVGEYEYTTVAGDENFPSNYEIGTVENAKIVVSPKALTLSAAYLGGTVTLSYSGTVNDDEITVTYSVKDVDLAQNTYTAVAADVSASLVAKVTPSSANYAAAELTLNAVYAVTFEVTEAFTGATGIPAAQYIFAGCLATEPDTEPAFDKYLFSYWDDQGAQYDFATPVEADITLVAVWVKDSYTYRFYAMRAGADYSFEGYRVLAWDDSNARFVLGAESSVYEFENGAAIPTVGTVGSFRIHHWVKAIKVEESYVYTTVSTFESEVSVELDEDAYYIAVMTLDIGKGDVDGDGTITAADVIKMKKYLVGVKFTVLSSEAAAWNKIGEAAPAGGYLYVFLWDANGDGYKDTRDIIVEREALATGYGYDIRSDVTVNDVYYSKEIIVTAEDEVFLGNVAGDANFVKVTGEEELLAALAAGKKVGCIADISISDDPDYPNDYRSYDVEEGDIYIDLGGHVLTVHMFQLKAKHGSVTIKNGYLAFDEDYYSGVIFASETGYTLVAFKKASDGYVLDQQGEGSTTIVANFD